MQIPWIICNKCFIHFDETKPNFYLTQCGHIFCRKCLSKLAGTCSICKTNGVQTMPISSPLSPVISPLFDDIQTGVNHLMMTAKFQKTQLEILYSREKYVANKYGALKTAYWQVLEQMKKMSQDFHRLREAYLQVTNSRAQAALKQSPKNRRVNFSNQNLFIRNEESNRNVFHSSRIDSEDSDASGSTIRAARTPTTPDGLFRIPTVTKIPRSAATSIGSSRASTPMSDYQQSSGYGSDARAYYP